MTAPPVVHYAPYEIDSVWEPDKPTVACDWGLDPVWVPTIANPDDVTCKNCRRTKVWREAQDNNLKG